MVRLLTSGPARIFSLEREGVGSLAIGSPADICVIDVDAEWRIDRDDMHSKSTNTPFHLRPVQGWAVFTTVDGRIVFDREGRAT
jgi:dihydroorotase